MSDMGKACQELEGKLPRRKPSAAVRSELFQRRQGDAPWLSPGLSNALHKATRKETIPGEHRIVAACVNPAERAW